jgi:hypothetical protein
MKINSKIDDGIDNLILSTIHILETRMHELQVTILSS